MQHTHNVHHGTSPSVYILPNNYNIKIIDNCCSPLNFTGTGIGGRGELHINYNNSLIGILQIKDSTLFNKLEDTNVKLDGIMHTLNQIRWTFYGAVGYYAISELGLMNALKLM